MGDNPNLQHTTAHLELAGATIAKVDDSDDFDPERKAPNAKVDDGHVFDPERTVAEVQVPSTLVPAELPPERISAPTGLTDAMDFEFTDFFSVTVSPTSRLHNIEPVKVE